MEEKYIVAIVAGGLFLLLFFVFLIVMAHRRNVEKQLQARLDEVYSDKNLVKMEYDFAVYDEETSKMITETRAVSEKQVTIYDVLTDGKLTPPEEVFGKIESEGMEEITGNYKPDNNV